MASHDTFACKHVLTPLSVVCNSMQNPVQADFDNSILCNQAQLVKGSLTFGIS